MCIALCALSIWLYGRSESGAWPFASHGAGYQAVFLQGGQVYFGKLSGSYGGGFTLEDIYYLGAASGTSSPSLVKLGTEYHGPADHMRIPAAQVLMWEDLNAQGAIAQAITDREMSPH